MLRKFYGWGRTLVRGPAMFGVTLDQTRKALPFSRGLRRVRTTEIDVVELWVPRATAEYLRWRHVTRKSLAGSRSSP